MKRRVRWAFGLWVLAAFGICGCVKDRTEPATQIIVTVESQFSGPQALTRLEFEVQKENGDKTDVAAQSVELVEADPGRGGSMPAVVTIVPPARRAADRFRLAVRGYGREDAADEAELVQYTATLSFKPGATLHTLFVLSPLCATPKCGEDESCYVRSSATGAMCAPIEDAETLDIDPPASNDPAALLESVARAEAAKASVSDPCTRNPCNRGQCQRDGTRAVCSCEGTGFGGSRCEEDLDRCARDNGGCAEVAICRDQEGPNDCQCPSTHLGDGRGAQGCETRVLKLAARASHTCALLATRQVKCWGRNFHGQLGDGSLIDRTEPVLVQGLDGVIEIAAGDEHTCAIAGDRSVHCWGMNDAGQLGDGTMTMGRSTPAPVQGELFAERIAVGTNHSCAQVGATQLRCWGWNDSGQLGDETGDNKPLPVDDVPYSIDGRPLPVLRLSAGERYNCVGHEEGVDCWGRFTMSASGPTGPRRVVSRAVKSLAAGRTHACAATMDDKVLCWGELPAKPGAPAEDAGMAQIDVGQGKVVALAVGTSHACAAFEDGRVGCWGLSPTGSTEPRQVPGLTDAQQVVIGWNSAAELVDQGCALLNNGSVQCWELDYEREPTQPYSVRGF